MFEIIKNLRDLGFPLIATIIAFLLVWNWVGNIGVALAAALITLLASRIAVIVWLKREAKLADLVDQFIDDLLQRLSYLRNPFQRNYHRWFLKKYGNLDLGGLEIDFEAVMQMEKVFVELTIDPEHSTTGGIIGKAGAESRNNIWHYFKQYTQYAITGYPGSGKSTLLRHIALVLISPRQRTRFRLRYFFPIYIPLRDYHDLILKRETPDLLSLSVQVVAKSGADVPQEWLKSRLNAGRCLIMFDGLDEVQSADDRKTIIAWVEEQLPLPMYSRNHFILTSRPAAYKANPLAKIGVKELKIQPFSPEQQNAFAQNWFLARELSRLNSRRATREIRARARDNADKFYAKIRQNETFAEFASSPLLATMMAMIYKPNQPLPESRVELYEKICLAQLGRRWQAQKIKLQLRPEQAQLVLQELAFHMMSHSVKGGIARHDALSAIQLTLASVTQEVDAGQTFLEDYERISGLLIEKEKSQFGFAHTTLEEYLAALHIAQYRNLESVLIDALCNDPSNDWWHETIRFYCAKADATNIINIILNLEPLRPNTLALAIECEQNALQCDPQARQQLSTLVQNVLQDHDDPRWRTVAEATLALHLKNTTVPVGDGIELIAVPFTHAHYQLFIDDNIPNETYFQPIHWQDRLVFEIGRANLPTLGVHANDVNAFYFWLTRSDTKRVWKYRLPKVDELRKIDVLTPCYGRVGGRMTVYPDNAGLDFLVIDIEAQTFANDPDALNIASPLDLIRFTEAAWSDARAKRISNDRKSINRRIYKLAINFRLARVHDRSLAVDLVTISNIAIDLAQNLARAYELSSSVEPTEEKLDSRPLAEEVIINFTEGFITNTVSDRTRAYQMSLSIARVLTGDDDLLPSTVANLALSVALPRVIKITDILKEKMQALHDRVSVKEKTMLPVLDYARLYLLALLLILNRLIQRAPSVGDNEKALFQNRTIEWVYSQRDHDIERFDLGVRRSVFGSNAGEKRRQEELVRIWASAIQYFEYLDKLFKGEIKPTVGIVVARVRQKPRKENSQARYQIK